MRELDVWLSRGVGFGSGGVMDVELLRPLGPDVV